MAVVDLDSASSASRISGPRTVHTVERRRWIDVVSSGKRKGNVAFDGIACLNMVDVEKRLRWKSARKIANGRSRNLTPRRAI